MTFERATEQDRQVVEAQIGRRARGLLGIARRCSEGFPQVTVNVAVEESGEGVEVFPTLFWLTCPYLVRAVSRLEAAGWVKVLERRVEGDPAFCLALERAHKSHATLRAALVPAGLRERLKRVRPELWAVVAETGVGGTRNWRSIKCLHAHLADFLARGENPVGELVRNQLVERGVRLAGEGVCREACVRAWYGRPQG